MGKPTVAVKEVKPGLPVAEFVLVASVEGEVA